MSADLKFSGENRKASLQQLVRAFEDVKSEAEGVRANGVPKAPIHRVALIHGEPGRGKTRLAIELYGKLREREDPAGYWPALAPKGVKQDQASLMPRAEACTYAPILPFLWWGMHVARGPNPGNTLLSSLPDLLPHLFTMRLAHRRSQGGKMTAAELADLAAELGMSVAELSAVIAGEAIGLGPVKRIAESMWRIGRIGQDRARDTSDPAGEGDRYAATATEEVLADLDRLLNPKSRQFAHRPAVILIDDAQSGDNDRPLAGFVEQLIERSARNRWPLLVLMTHWSRNLDDTETATGEPVPRSLVAQVLERVRQTPEPGPVWFGPPPTAALPETCFLQLDLNDEVDLKPALADRYPGIDPETVAAITDNAGGNPRKLEQIVAKMHRAKSWFEGHDRSRNLSAKGRAAALALSQLPIDEIVYDRLVEAPAGVRRSLALASIAGNRFVVDFVDKLADACLAEGARPQLEEGESKYYLLRDIRDRSRNDIGGFSDRLYFDAAGRYRRNAPRDFKDWPDDETLFARLDELLGRVVDDPDTFEALQPEDLAFALSVAAERMMALDDSRAGLALARLVSIENTRGNYEGAYDAANRFIEGFRP